jgi:hypothetical protein
MLADGELIRADDSEYHPNDIGIWKLAGRSLWTADDGTLRSVTGLRFLEFDGNPNAVIIVRNANATLPGAYQVYWDNTAARSDIGLTSGTWTTAQLITGGLTLDTVHYNNKHYALNGVDRNYVVSYDSAGNLQLLLHGMLANVSVPTVALTGAGTGFTLSSNNTVTYWVEERVKVGSTITKRNSADSTTLVVLTGTGILVKPVITRPAVVNSDTTHWALFATATNTPFPVGAEIAEVPIATTTIEDTRTGTDPGLPTGSTYNILSVTIAGVTEDVPMFGPPPIATTGDIAEDCLVLNDIANPSHVRWGFYDTPEAFPSLNLIRFETKENDIVRLIKTLGNITIVGLRDSLWRINTFPQIDDASFQPGRVKTIITDRHGIVGPLAAAPFDWGAGLRLAYVSNYGVHVTDGYSWDDISDDLDWKNTVNVSALSSSFLINKPDLYQLWFFFAPLGSTTVSKFMIFHYHPSHAKASQAGGFRAKLAGPNNLIAMCSAIITVSGQKYLLSGGNPDGNIYIEGIGNSDASGSGGIAFNVITPDIYLAGATHQAGVRELGVHHNACPGQSATVTLTRRRKNNDDQTETRVMALDLRETSTVSLQHSGDCFQLGVSNNDSLGPIRIDFLTYDYEDQGVSKA